MNKVAHYLQEHLMGEVVVGDDARRFFSTDGSIFQIVPAIIAYPRSENDVRKTARFVWQLAERKRIIPLTPRGLGSSTAGSAIGGGILMVFPAHLNKIIELDSRSGTIVIEPGASIDKLQQTLHTHGRFLPAIPVDYQNSSIGGAAAINASGEKTSKYGTIKNFIKRTRVVLANGEVIETRRLSKKELSKKLGLSTFEGEIYRAIDTLIEENHDIIKNFALDIVKNSAGYDIFSVKRKDKSFDLTPLIAGSEGTLGIITELELETEPYNPKTTIISAKIDDLGIINELIKSIRSFKDTPSVVDIIGKGLIDFIDKANPNLIKDVFTQPYPQAQLIVEFDSQSERQRAKSVKKLKKIFNKFDVDYAVETDENQKLLVRKVRDLVSTYLGHEKVGKRALPIVNDAVVPPGQFLPLLQTIYDICKGYQMTPAVWGQALDAGLSFYPLLDVGQLGDRQKILRVMDEYYNKVIELGGSISSDAGDGRLKSPYLVKMYGPDIYQIFEKIKQIFDPFGILNPGVKLGTSTEDIKSLLRDSYSLEQKHNYLPRA